MACAVASPSRSHSCRGRCPSKRNGTFHSHRALALPNRPPSWRQGMYPLASIAGGFLATLAVLSLAVPGPASWPNLSFAPTSPATNTADQLDRSPKGDRRVGTRLSDSQDESQVTTVEVVGL